MRIHKSAERPRKLLPFCIELYKTLPPYKERMFMHMTPWLNPTNITIVTTIKTRKRTMTRNIIKIMAAIIISLR